MQAQALANQFTQFPMAPSDISSQLQTFVNVTSAFPQQPLLQLQSPYLNYTGVDLSTYRTSDYHALTEFLADYLNDSQSQQALTLGNQPFAMTAIFSGRNHNSVQSILGLGAYLWYFLLVLCIMWWIK